MWVLNQLLFADDTGFGADSESRLEQLVKDFGRVCEKRKDGGIVMKVKPLDALDAPLSLR